MSRLILLIVFMLWMAWQPGRPPLTEFDPSMGAFLFIALYALLAVLVGRRFYGNRTTDSADPLLNDRAGRLVGKVVAVVVDVDDNNGRVRVGDSEWNARGGPAAAGERVRITGVDGNCLNVEPVRTLPPA